MAINHGHLGPNATFAYQMSGIPYVTSSAADEVTTSIPIQLSLPFVTKFFKVTNIDDTHTLKFGFTANGVKGNPNDHFITLAAGASSATYDWRVKDIFFLGGNGAAGFRVEAGLTTIKRAHFPILSGTLEDGTAGYEGIG
jgi:hypothetical protein